MDYQSKQLNLINNIEKSFKAGKSSSTIVEPVSDYINDNRMCLTSVVFIPYELEQKIIELVINHLKEADPRQYFYVPRSFHITINNIRTIENPPLFNNDDIEKAKSVFSIVVPKYHSFTFELKKLFELPTSIVIAALSNEVLANIALELREELEKAGVPDNKVYASNDVVIGSATVSRFTKPPNEKFEKKVKELKEIEVGNFKAEKISLITTNAACHPSKTTIIENYYLS